MTSEDKQIVTDRFLLSRVTCFFHIILSCFLFAKTPLNAAEAEAFRGFTMGTTYVVKIFKGKGEPDVKRQLHLKIESTLKEVNRQMSTYIKDSELSLFNQDKRVNYWFPVSADTAFVASKALEISHASEGSFDATLGPLVNLWGFGPDDRPLKIPDSKILQQTLKKTGYRHFFVRLNPPALKKSESSLYIDFSGIAKGFGVDKVAEDIESFGHKNYMVEIGGEIRTSGQKGLEAWKIAIERPEVGLKGRSIYKVLNLGNSAVATSGDYRNFYEKNGKRYSHIIDPRTGYPLDHGLISVTVVDQTAISADAWATAFFVSGPKKIREISEKLKLAVFFVSSEHGRLIEWSSSRFKELESAAATG